VNLTSIKLYSTSLDLPVTGTPPYPYVIEDDPHVEFSLGQSAESSPYIIKGATGLNAPDLSEWGGTRSVHTNFGALTPRTIDILVALNPNNSEGHTISELRDILYRMISSPGFSGVTLVFMDGETAIAYIDGQINKIDTSSFSKTPEAVLSIYCEDPLMRGWGGAVPEVTLEEDPDPDHIWVNDTLSTAPHGFHLIIKWTSGTPGTFSMLSYLPQLRSSSWAFDDYTVFEVDVGLSVNQRLVINSRYSSLGVSKEVTPGNWIGVGSHITAESVWPVIYPGMNWYHFPDKSSFDITHFSHTVTYWGV